MFSGNQTGMSNHKISSEAQIRLQRFTLDHLTLTESSYFLEFTPVVMATSPVFHGKSQVCGQISSIFTRKNIHKTGCFQTKKLPQTMALPTFAELGETGGAESPSTENSHFDVPGAMKSGL